MNAEYIDNLAYDVGMHTGQDTAYYLHRGFQVVAIEANPDLVQRAEKKFAAAIDAGTLKILQLGIAATTGEEDFYISTQKSVWSSFDKANATKNGSGFRTCRIQCVPFELVLQQHGIPRFLKVDIEGSDHLCIEALQGSCLPAYVSSEMSHAKSGHMLRHLAAIGYTGFKFVRQNDYRVINPEELEEYLASRKRLQARGLRGNIQRRFRNLRLRVRRPHHNNWSFPKGASGPFGEELAGRWASADEALQVWRALTDADLTQCGAALGDWFDIHAQR